MRAIGDDWYSYVIQGTASASMVFTDSEGQQTSDLFRDQDGWYVSEGWSATDPEVIVSTPANREELAPSSIDAKTGSREVYYSTAQGR
jgi:glycerol kinase